MFLPYFGVIAQFGCLVVVLFALAFAFSLMASCSFSLIVLYWISRWDCFPGCASVCGD